MSTSAAPLRYVEDSEPGFSRRRRYSTWHYFDPDGARITHDKTLSRLDGLAVPPAYTQVWYCCDANGHLQATGRDAKGRKQYRYHEAFRAKQEADKFGRTAEFGRQLPAIRETVERDLRRRNLSQERMLAATVRMLDIGALRIGNQDYARRNGAYGATTLTKDHADVRGDRLHLNYTAKGGKQREINLTDGSLARLARRCQDLSGQHLFAWQDQDGRARGVSSGEVNDYIREAMGADFTAKHFRTWHASAIAFWEIIKSGGDISLKAMLEPVAERLGNTVAISRKSYVHPALIEMAKENETEFVAGLRLPRKTKYLASYERGLIELLSARG